MVARTSARGRGGTGLAGRARRGATAGGAGRRLGTRRLRRRRTRGGARRHSDVRCRLQVAVEPERHVRSSVVEVDHHDQAGRVVHVVSEGQRGLAVLAALHVEGGVDRVVVLLDLVGGDRLHEDRDLGGPVGGVLAGDPRGGHSLRLGDGGGVDSARVRRDRSCVRSDDHGGERRVTGALGRTELVLEVLPS